MSAAAINMNWANPYHRPAGALDLSPLARAAVLVAGLGMSTACLFAIGRALIGLAPDLDHLRNAAIVFHVSTVIPCVPLGLFLLLATKGTPRHKQWGKVWVALMLTTATSALFLRGFGNFTWIHIFVPFTYRACWKIVSTARRGDFKAHRNEIVSLYLGALMIPGIAAFAIPGRLMNAMLLG